MPLQFKNIAVGNLQDDVSGNNYAANKAVYILNLNNTLAQIFSDEAGTTPIVQDGVNNVTGAKGVFGFWVEAGDYFVQVGANKYRVSITGADYFNNRVDETVDLIVDAVAGRGAYYPVGSFEAGFTYTDINQVGTFGGTDYYIYTGGLTNLPHNVTAGTDPTLSSDYAQVFYGEIDSVQGLRDELNDRAIYLTLSEAQAKTDLVAGQYVRLTDRGYGLFKIVADSDTGGRHYEQLTGKKLRLNDGCVYLASNFGDLADGQDNTTTLKSAFENTSGATLYIDNGTYLTSETLFPSENSDVYFYGTVKLNSAANPIPTSVVRLSKPNITLHHPYVDGNFTEIGDSQGGSGIYSGVAIYDGVGTRPDNCKIIGGMISDCVHNAIQGGGRNLIVDGTALYGAGEHLVYINETDGSGGTTGTKISLKNLHLDRPALSISHSEAHYIQIRNSNVINIDNVRATGAGEADPNEPTFAVLMDNVARINVSNSEFEDLTSRFLWSNGGTAKFENVTASTRTGLVKALQRTSGAEFVSYDNCDFTGFFVGSESLADSSIFHKTEFNLSSRFDIYSDHKFTDCDFNYSDSVSAGFWAIVHSGHAEFVGSEFKGVNGLNLWGQGSSTLTVERCKFPDIPPTTNNQLRCLEAARARFVANELPNATSVKTIGVAATVTEKCIIKENYIPNGNIEDLSTVAIVNDNITV